MSSVDNDFLTKGGTINAISVVFSGLLEIQPADPLAYICDYLGHLQSDHKSFPTQHAAALCKIFHWTSSEFWENTFNAFQLLSTRHNERGESLDISTFTGFLNQFMESYQIARHGLKALVCSWLDQDTRVSLNFLRDLFLYFPFLKNICLRYRRITAIKDQTDFWPWKN
ncbi:hypothetical protein BC829DRAFT_52741 [Chytridium lagenaria]|nr:hypothetical protein BC829DRAFT_52741 [Chytridium lagenaria]